MGGGPEPGEGGEEGQQGEEGGAGRAGGGQHRVVQILNQPTRHAGGAWPGQQPRPPPRQLQPAVHSVIHRPQVGRPVGVAQPALEREQAGQQLRQLQRTETGTGWPGFLVCLVCWFSRCT